MPTERRKIIFSDDELSLAVASYGRVTPNFLPPGEIQAVRLDTSGDIRLIVTIRMRYGDGSRFIEIETKAAIFVELLIRACLEHNIPIPRRAEKTLAICDGAIALAIEIGCEDGSSVTAPGSQQRFATASTSTANASDRRPYLVR